MTSIVPVAAITVPSISQKALNLISQHGDTSYRCGEWDGDEAGDYNTVHGEASDAEADLIAYVAELEKRAGAAAVRRVDDDPNNWYWQAKHPLTGRYIKVSRDTGRVIEQSDEPFPDIDVSEPRLFREAIKE